MTTTTILVVVVTTTRKTAAATTNDDVDAGVACACVCNRGSDDNGLSRIHHALEYENENAQK